MSAIDDIKAKIDIVDLIGETVSLRKAGRTFKAVCPFHAEKTPSFIVSPDRQTWHCFGACGTGGDAFAFVQRRDGVDFPEALRILAERAGVTLAPRNEARAERNERLYAANESAAVFFESRLLQSDDAAAAREYLARRGVDDETARAFRLGYAPEGWDGLRTYLERRGFTAAELLAAGLLVESERGGYDRFRGRLMFPIADERGRVVGFGGRTLGDDVPKYLNTPQTEAFDKGGTIYALDKAKEAIRKEGAAVIVEGYMDVIAAHQHGYRNVVASMGTALTERQVNLLKRYSHNLVLALDADAAGSEATLRDIQVVVGAADREALAVPDWRGLVRYQDALAADIRVVALPSGKDPDDTIRERPEAWRELIAGARPVLDHLLAAARDRFDLAQPRERSKALDTLLPALADIADPVVQAHYLQRLATLAQVPEVELQSRLRRRARAARPPSPSKETPSAPPTRDGHDREEFLLALLLRHPSLRAVGTALDAQTFWSGEHRALFEAWRERPEPPDDGEPIRACYERIIALRLPPYDAEQASAALESALRLLERDRLLAAKRLATAALVEESEGLTQEVVVERAAAALADPGGPDAALAPAAVVLRDLEAGMRLHGRQGAPAGDGTAIAVETRTDDTGNGGEGAGGASRGILEE